MKKVSCFVVFLFVTVFGTLCAQPYGNEWIAFVAGQPYSTQQYFRIAVWKEGIYRISYNDMQSAGVPVSTWFSPERYQLYNNGKQQFIQVLDANSDNLFGPGDFIEFYGRANEGEYDRSLYDTPLSQGNPYVSLFNDTAVYFLTYSPFSTNNRRMPVVTDSNYGDYQAEPWCMAEDLKVFGSLYNIGQRDYNDIGDNSFTEGEGYMSQLIGKFAPFDVSFTVKKYLSSGPSPRLETTIMGANANYHPYQLLGDGTLLKDTAFIAYRMVNHGFDITNLGSSGSYTLRFAPQPDPFFNGNINYMQMSWARLRYPRSFDLSGESLPRQIYVSGTSKVMVEFSNLAAQSPRFYLIGKDTVKLLSLSQSGNAYRSIIPVYGNEERCMLMEASQVYSAPGNTIISTVNPDPDPARFARFRNLAETVANPDFLVVSHKGLWNGANDYAAYRQSKGFNVLLVDADELYDQFAWGIRKHVLAIRNFSDYMLDLNNPKPEYLLLLGKSVVSKNAKSGAGYTLNLVPTFGEPASDVMFTARLNSNRFVPELATGRIAAQSNQDLRAYLDKLIAFELQQAGPPAEWMKHVMHFGGGTDISEQNLLADKLGAYRTIIQDTLFGGTVNTILKNSTDPIQINLSQFIQQRIDSGCTMMTFYGHAAGTSFDISTDDPEFYNNRDRYPVVLALSCFVGDIHTTSRLLNERFVLTPDKGSIAFVAVPEKGIIDPLDDYSNRLHRNIFNLNYGSPLAANMLKTIDEIIDSTFDRKSVCMNMTLHGDPAIVMNSYELPDYSVSDPGIVFSPERITTALDSFEVKIAVANFGRNTSDSLRILLSRTLPGGNKKDSIFQVSYVSYIDTVSITLPVDYKDGAGLNRFEVTVDVYDDVDEIDDVGNNVARAQLQIGSSDINPVFPREFAIVPDAAVVLKATTAEPFAAPRTFRFEIDTSPFFDSPQLRTGIVPNSSGIVVWPVTPSPDSNKVYFWRVANDSITDPDSSIASQFQWRRSSFIYRPGITGWSQAHYHQFRENQLSNVFFVDSLRQTGFISSNYSLVMTHEINRPSYEINGVNMDYGGCFGIPQLAVAVLDSIDFENPWEADSCVRYYGNYNYYNCNTADGCASRTRADRYFLFNVSAQAGIDSMISMMNNHVPDGNYLLSWCTFSANFDTLLQLKNAFSALGVPQFSSLQDGQKYMLFMKKGDPSSVIFRSGAYPDSLIRIDYLLSRDWDKGFQTSQQVGPALSWSSLNWDYSSLEMVNSGDSIHLKVYGIGLGGQEELLLDEIPANSSPVDLSGIDASTYPYLRLKAYLQDLELRTPPQLSQWQVYYQPVPEGALNTRYFSFYRDTLQEGEDAILDIAFENISDVGMDTLLVDYFVFDAANVRRNLASTRLHRNLPAGDTVLCKVRFNTESLAGKNSLWVEVNPRNDQPEQYHFNNIANLDFNVSRDRTNPLLDVTFDGIHILNGDIVSAKPEISIRLKDENRFIALNDTSNFRISLKSPSGVLRYLSFEPAQGASGGTELLAWQPAVLPENSFRIYYRPYLTEDGIYTLSVQATDEAGNLSGVNDYRIQFEVINRSSITEVINYPNPFSSSTRFVFILTGAVIPDQFKIQIMTVTGKVVREIMRDEIGPIRIGRNVTDYAWDGRDEFGDQLANGVYLYRVVTNINGSEIEKKSTVADPYFKKGWGKMYLMR